MIWPRLSPEVNLGHLFQAAVVVLMMAPGYVDLVRDQARLEAEQKAIIAAQLAEQAAENLRMTTDEQYDQHRMDATDNSIAAFEAEIRGQINKVLDRIGELSGVVLDAKRPR